MRNHRLNIWQWIIVVLWGLSFLSGMVLYGKPRIDGGWQPGKISAGECDRQYRNPVYHSIKIWIGSIILSGLR